MKKRIAYSESNKLGKFNIPHERDEDDREMLGALFAICVLLEVHEHESGRGRTYIAASELFQPLSEGDEIPEYRLEYVCNQHFENEEREARRINSGPFGFVAIRKTIVRVPPVAVGINLH